MPRQNDTVCRRCHYNTTIFSRCQVIASIFAMFYTLFIFTEVLLSDRLFILLRV